MATYSSLRFEESEDTTTKNDSEDEYYSVRSGDISGVSIGFLSVASAPDDPSLCCDPCSRENCQKSAEKYCPQCRENMCSDCLQCHAKFVTTRSHQILEMPREITNTVSPFLGSIDFCSPHDNEAIKFFCPDHSQVGCYVCMTLFHINCKRQYIPDICTDVLTSHDLQNTLTEINEGIDSAESIVKKTKAIKRENQKYNEKAKTDIEQFYIDITEKMDKMKKRLIKKADEDFEWHNSELNKVSVAMATMINDLEKIKTTIESCGAACEPTKAFIALKNIQEKLKRCDRARKQVAIDAERSRLIFRPNEGLRKIIYQSNGFGFLIVRHKESVDLLL